MGALDRIRAEKGAVLIIFLDRLHHFGLGKIILKDPGLIVDEFIGFIGFHHFPYGKGNRDLKHVGPLEHVLPGPDPFAVCCNQDSGDLFGVLETISLFE